MNGVPVGGHCFIFVCWTVTSASERRNLTSALLLARRGFTRSESDARCLARQQSICPCSCGTGAAWIWLKRTVSGYQPYRLQCWPANVAGLNIRGNVPNPAPPATSAIQGLILVLTSSIALWSCGSLVRIIRTGAMQDPRGCTLVLHLNGNGSPELAVVGNTTAIPSIETADSGSGVQLSNIVCLKP
jgi:hypothetical protein